MSIPTNDSQRSRLERITLKGFKSIRSLVDLEPRSRTVMIGPNGAGKSNFISFFQLMNRALSGPSQLALYVGRQGGSRRILHDGLTHTREIEAEISIRTAKAELEYAFRLFHGTEDTLIFAEEKYRTSRPDLGMIPEWVSLGAGHNAPRLLDAMVADKTAAIIHEFLRRTVVYEFHNTSSKGRIRGGWPIDDSRWLKEDAANIAPILYRLKTQDPKYYQRIIDVIQLVVPAFSDFVFEPYHGVLNLQWRERGTDEVFSASQASDGFLGIAALFTLLLLPAQELPDILILDNPEHRLHPEALNVVAGLITAASLKVQVIIATQSDSLVDYFDPEDIVVVDRPGRESTFRRLDPSSLKLWLDSYTLSQLWEKNVIGGKP